MTRHHRSASRAPSQRQLRVGELIRHALSDALVHGDLHDPDLDDRSITVSEVRTS
ncbi:MAG: ribosome-binding factor A, partial [Paracoccaceae bacterium]